VAFCFSGFRKKFLSGDKMAAPSLTSIRADWCKDDAELLIIKITMEVSYLSVAMHSLIAQGYSEICQLDVGTVIRQETH
jgi:hypothetical protein